MQPHSRDSQPLSPYTALDLTEGGFNWCGKLLADLGADVIKVEPPGGSPTRSISPFVDDAPEGADRSLFWAAYCANKRGATLDLESDDGAARLRRLAARADFLIESFEPGRMASLGLGYGDLAALNPALVYTSITPYGQTGPYAPHRAPDLVAWSMGGMTYLCGDADRAPTRISAPQAELHAAGQAAAATMAAFWHRQMTGEGQHVDVSMQAAVVWTLMNATPFPPLHGVNVERDGAFRARGAVAARQVFTCSDGHVSVIMAPRTISALADWMAEDGAAPNWLLEIDWSEYTPLGAGDNDSESVELFLAIQALAERHIATKSKRELYMRAIDRGMLLAPCNTVEDIAHSEQLAARGFWRELEYPALGRSLTHLGAFVKLSESPLQVRRPAPRVGEHNEDILGTLDDLPAEREPRRAAKAARPRAMPFDGIRILDFTWVGVGPITTKHLADYGADVIRVESASRPDVLRGGAPFKDATPGINRSQFSANYNTSKRGLGVNLALPEGRGLIRRLIREWKPDIVAESFTPRVMTGWGLGYADVREMAPGIIYFSTCQQGQTGPHSSYAGFGQLAGALAGFYHITGWHDREPAGPYGAYSDFINPPNAAAAIVAALEYRRRTGRGQHIDLSQYECAAQYIAPAIMDFTANGRVLNRRGNDDDVAAPHGVYRCADRERRYTGLGEQWIAIAVSSNREWRALCRVMGDANLAGDARLASPDGRRAHSAEIDAAIGAWTRSRDARELMIELQNAGVPAGVAQSQADLWEDPQLAHRGFFQWLDHAECGPMPYDGLAAELSLTPGALRMPQALIGQHSAEILGETLGMSDDEIADLAATGALEFS